MSMWKDFNDAPQQASYDLIPKGAIVPVRMMLKPGGYNDESQGWTGGYATQSAATGSIYLAAEFVILEGEFARRKVWANIGLKSPKGPTWGEIGRGFLRAALNSARNIAPRDTSPAAIAARCVNGLHDLDGLEFIARIDHEKDANGELRNTIKIAIEPGHSQYSPLRATSTTQHYGPISSTSVAHIAQSTATAAVVLAGKPSWA